MVRWEVEIKRVSRPHSLVYIAGNNPETLPQNKVEDEHRHLGVPSGLHMHTVVCVYPCLSVIHIHKGEYLLLMLNNSICETLLRAWCIFFLYRLVHCIVTPTLQIGNQPMHGGQGTWSSKP